MKEYAETAERLFHEAKYPEYQYNLLVESMKKIAGQPPLLLKNSTGVLRELPITAKAEHAIFFRIDPPQGAKVGSVYEFDIFQRDSKKGVLLSGSRYRVVVNKGIKQEK